MHIGPHHCIPLPLALEAGPFLLAALEMGPTTYLATGGTKSR